MSQKQNNDKGRQRKHDEMARRLLKQVNLGDLSDLCGEEPRPQEHQEEPKTQERRKEIFKLKEIAEFLLGTRPREDNLFCGLSEGSPLFLLRVRHLEYEWINFYEEIDTGVISITRHFIAIDEKEIDVSEGAVELPLESDCSIVFDKSTVRSICFEIDNDEEETRSVSISTKEGSSCLIVDCGYMMSVLS